MNAHRRPPMDLKDFPRLASNRTVHGIRLADLTILAETDAGEHPGRP